MGMRTQTFLVTPNVFKKVEHWLFHGDKERMQAARKALINADLSNLPTFQMKAKDNQKLVEVELEAIAEAFGDELLTVLAHHHQSLYGGEAVHLVHHVLDFCKNVTDTYNPFSLRYWQLQMVDLRTLPRFVDFVYGLLTVKHDYQLAKDIDSCAGFSHASFLNLDHPQMRHYFDRYQNDEGIIIIDTIEQKYCFMDIIDVGNYQLVDAPTYYNRYYLTDEKN